MRIVAIRLGVLAFALLLLIRPSPASADDEPAKSAAEAGCAEVMHWACTFAAALRLAETTGDPQVLAPEALVACKGEEAALASLMAPEDLEKHRAKLVVERVETIKEWRAKLAQPATGK